MNDNRAIAERQSIAADSKEQRRANSIERHQIVREVEWVRGRDRVRYFVTFEADAIPDNFHEFFGLEFVGAWITHETYGIIDAFRGGLGSGRMKAVYEIEVSNL